MEVVLCDGRVCVVRWRVCVVCDGGREGVV